MKSKTRKAAGKASLDPLVLPSVLGDSLAELNRMRDSITASMGIPARFLRCDPPLHPTYSEYQATARAEWRRQNARAGEAAQGGKGGDRTAEGVREGDAEL